MADNAPEIKSKVTEADLRAAAMRHNMTLQISWNYERMQALGFAWSIIPVLKKVYTNTHDLFEAIKRHMVFYNTHPSMSAVIFGAACAMEEQQQGDVADSLKVALMGPLAGIGDTLAGVLLRPIVGVFAASLALAGNPVGPLLMIALGVAWFLVRWPLFWFGYKRGINVALDMAQGGRIQQITDGASILGLTVVGGFVPSILAKVKTPLKITQAVTAPDGKVVSKVVELQSVLDKILPYMIPVAITALAYWMLHKLKWSPVKVLFALVVLGFALSALGIL